MNDLIDAVYNYFRGTRFVSEQVFIDVPSSGQERSVERAIIIEKLDNTVPITLEKKVGDKRQQQREAREAKEFAEAADKIPHDPHHYMVQQVKNKKKTYVVAPNQMRRPRQLLSKATIKLYIKDVASREGKFNAVWLVKVLPPSNRRTLLSKNTAWPPIFRPILTLCSKRCRLRC